MVERRPIADFIAHAVLIIGILIVCFPLYLAFVASTHTAQDVAQSPMPLLPGSHMAETYQAALFGATTRYGGLVTAVWPMMWVSFVSAMIIAVGKISISLLSAFAIVYFRFPFRMFFFWAIFITLMLPVEVRIGPTYKVVSDLNMLNTYAGLTVPLIASATATFLFRQFFLTAGGSGAYRSRRADEVLQRHLAAALENLDRCAVRDSVYLWLEPILVATVSDHR
jgi:sn-glycerol 3-phosphate transport system permease protein